MIASPLDGKRILVTRAPHQASELADQLRSVGAVPILIPTIEIAAPASFAVLDDAVSRLETFDLLIFTSANAVDAFRRRAELLRQTCVPRRIAVVGPATARAVERVGLRAEIIPTVFTAEFLALTLAHEVAGQRILIIRVEGAPDTLPDILTTAGAEITIAPAYASRIPSDSGRAITELFSLSERHPDAITFTSASTANNLSGLLRSASLTLPADIVRASIGPVTTRALGELGWAPHVEAEEATLASLVAALASHFAQRVHGE